MEKYESYINNKLGFLSTNGIVKMTNKVDVGFSSCLF